MPGGAHRDAGRKDKPDKVLLHPPPMLWCRKPLAVRRHPTSSLLQVTWRRYGTRADSPPCRHTLCYSYRQFRPVNQPDCRRKPSRKGIEPTTFWLQETKETWEGTIKLKKTPRMQHWKGCIAPCSIAELKTFKTHFQCRLFYGRCSGNVQCPLFIMKQKQTLKATKIIYTVRKP